LSVGLTIRPWKKFLVMKTKGVKTGLMEGRRPGETRNDETRSGKARV